MKLSLATLDRRIVYLLILLALSVPLMAKLVLTPTPMASAKLLFEEIEKLEREPGKFVLLFLDFGPNSKAENFPQAEVLIEHLLRKRIPFLLTSQYLQAEPLLEAIPAGVVARLQKDNPGEHWQYGTDWANLGYRVGGFLFIKGFAETADIPGFIKRDARGNDTRELPVFGGVKTLESVRLVAQLTSLTGTLETILQFFQNSRYRPPVVHGCTSITIPQAYNFLDSGQLRGLLEGIAGAASYDAMLQSKFAHRSQGNLPLIMTGLGVAHLIIIALVVFGNVAAWRSRST